eukprot:6206593-Pleurochrysis_carterae.AAC.2
MTPRRKRTAEAHITRKEESAGKICMNMFCYLETCLIFAIFMHAPNMPRFDGGFDMSSSTYEAVKSLNWFEPTDIEKQQ